MGVSVCVCLCVCVCVCVSVCVFLLLSLIISAQASCLFRRHYFVCVCLWPWNFVLFAVACYRHSIGRPLFCIFGRTLVCVRARARVSACGRMGVLQLLVIGIPLSYWFHRVCVCVCVCV